MDIKLDLHTHTSFSPHAYSTLMENIDVAIKRGLEGIAMTNHGPSALDFSHRWHFTNLKCIPRNIKGIVVFTGVECTFTDTNGTLDFDNELLKKMDIVIASRHGGREFLPDETNYRETLINSMENPYVDILGHVARTNFSLEDWEYDEIAKTAKVKGKLLELNETCLVSKNTKPLENSKRLMIACKKYGTPIVVNSDAHICTAVGDFSLCMKLLEEIDFDEELVMNTSLEKFLAYMSERKNIDMLKGEKL